MNDDLATGLIIIAIGLGLLAYCMRGIIREVGSSIDGKRDWALIVLAGGAALGGVAIIAVGILYISVMLYSTDL